MGDIVTQRNVAAILLAIASVRSQSASAAVNGNSIDRFAHSVPGSCLLHQDLGAVTGSPTAVSVVTVLQDSADGVTFANYLPDGVNVAQTPAATAADTDAQVAVDLTAARRYIRAVTTPTFTGGTSPAALVAANVILGGENTQPAT